MSTNGPEKTSLAMPKGREAILDAATALFAEHGYNDADTQALAEKLGVGKGTLYRHFASKRELFLAAVDRVMRRMREYIDASVAEVDDPSTVWPWRSGLIWTSSRRNRNTSSS